MSDYVPVDLGQDLSPEEVASPSAELIQAPAQDGLTAIIRTSDRIAFKRCRRRWGWSSALRGNLGSKWTIDPLWFGTGIHFAFEDYHGYNVYGHPKEAFKAYYDACYRNRNNVSLPPSHTDLRELGIALTSYYADYWLIDRPQFKTLWVDGVPQVEVRALIEVPFNPRELYPNSPFSRVLYSVTIDRVIVDEDTGRLFLVDYKTAKQFQTMHFLTDPQIGAYYWCGGNIYNIPIEGFIYQQHLKQAPEQPRILSTGKISSDSRQLTTHRLYRRALVNLYGDDFQKWPSNNLTMLNELAASEDMYKDKFVRRDKIYRNEYSFEAEGAKILLELEDMLNPDLPLYPNPTRDCAYTCSFHNSCVSMDDGSDWFYELSLTTQPRSPQDESWRKLLPSPAPQQANPITRRYKAIPGRR